MGEKDDSESFLDEDFLRKLEKIKILAQKGLKGPSRGEHTSWRSGASLDFLDYRKYQVGDDFRYIDWNVYGRLDRLFIKLFRAEEDLTIHFLLDMSRSMGAGKPTKSLFAKKITASLCYVGLANFDRVGVTSFNHSLGEALSPERGKQVYLTVLKYLLALEPEGNTDINTSLTEYAAGSSRPGIALVISDLMDPKGFEKGLEALTYGKFDLTLIHLLDPEELRPSFHGYLSLKEIETGAIKKMTVDRILMDSYHRRMNGYLEKIKRFCRNNRIDYYLTDTSIPFEDFLLDYLTKGALFQ